MSVIADTDATMATNQLVNCVGCKETFAGILMLAMSGAQAQECLLGAWEGTLGKTTVTLEFINTYNEDATAGRYYYGNRLTDLLLTWRDESDAWQEIDPHGKTTGTLTLACTGDRLSGTWRKPDGKGAQPVMASRIERTHFAQRRLAALVPQHSAPQSFEGHRYATLSVPEVADVSTVMVLDAVAGAAAINTTLNKAFLENLEQAQSCAAYGRLMRGDNAGFAHEASSEVLAWNSDYLVIRQFSGGFCGGAHPYHSSPVQVFVTRDGSLEQMSRWLLPQYADSIKPDTALGQVLMDGYQKARGVNEGLQECVDAVSFQADIWPMPDGMVFASDSSYAAQACNKEVIVPYAQVQPFLSAYGREHAKSFDLP